MTRTNRPGTAGKTRADRLPPIHNHPVVPEGAKRHRNARELPVTRGDMAADLRNGMQFFGCDWRTSPMYRHIFHDTRLVSALYGQWYGNIEDRSARSDPGKKGLSVPGWEKAAATLAGYGLYIPMLNSMAKSAISREHHDAMLRIFGRRWFGHNEGEWDGAYIGMTAHGVKPTPGVTSSAWSLPPERTRREACRHYLDWMGECYRLHHNYMVTISSLGMGCHYAAELGTRMVGLELAQALPSNNVLLAFCRGAGKQYDLLMTISPSVFAWRGATGLKCYPKTGQPQSLLLDRTYLAGPDHGSTLGLLKRLWWLSYMNGASVIEFEAGYFPCDAAGEYAAQGSLEMEDPVTMRTVMAHFTPIGWLFWEMRNAARRNPMRGVPYVPFALMLPFDHGWYPQPNYYHNRPDEPDTPGCVWGNIPYNDGDRQIDAFFQWVFPGYPLANRVDTRDERGLLSNTPFGDSFDVILDNADENCLSKYRAVILLGSWETGLPAETRERLERFARAGGTVIADTGQWPSSATKGRGKPLSVRVSGNGRMILVTEPSWGAGNPDGGALESIREALADYLLEYTLIEIDGRPIHYLLNVTDRPDELIVTLCNNSAALPWEGAIRVRGETIVECEEWLAYGESGIANGALRCGVPANDARTFRLRTRRPFLDLQFSNIPWKNLGFRVPE